MPDRPAAETSLVAHGSASTASGSVESFLQNRSTMLARPNTAWLQSASIWGPRSPQGNSVSLARPAAPAAHSHSATVSRSPPKNRHSARAEVYEMQLIG